MRPATNCIRTLSHRPDLSPGHFHDIDSIKIAESVLGLRHKQRPGYKKARKLRLLPKALILRKQGMHQAEIARKLNMPRSTLHDWLKKA